MFNSEYEQLKISIGTFGSMKIYDGTLHWEYYAKSESSIGLKFEYETTNNVLPDLLIAWSIIQLRGIILQSLNTHGERIIQPHSTELDIELTEFIIIFVINEHRLRMPLRYLIYGSLYRECKNTIEITEYEYWNRLGEMFYGQMPKLSDDFRDKFEQYERNFKTVFEFSCKINGVPQAYYKNLEIGVFLDSTEVRRDKVIRPYLHVKFDVYNVYDYKGINNIKTLIDKLT